MPVSPSKTTPTQYGTGSVGIDLGLKDSAISLKWKIELMKEYGNNWNGSKMEWKEWNGMEWTNGLEWNGMDGMDWMEEWTAWTPTESGTTDQ